MSLQIFQQRSSEQVPAESQIAAHRRDMQLAIDLFTTHISEVVKKLHLLIITVRW